MRVVVTGARIWRALQEALSRHGIEVVAAPVLELRPREVDVDAVIGSLRRSDLAAFLSAQSMHAVAEAARAAGRLGELRDAAARLVIAVAEGAKAAQLARSLLGVEPRYVAESPAELAEAVEPGYQNCAVFHHGERDHTFVEKLSARCGRVEEHQPYETAMNEDAVRAIADVDADVYVFTSATAVKVVAANPAALERLRRGVAVVPGDALARELEALGVRTVVARGRVPGLIEAILRLAGRG